MKMKKIVVNSKTSMVTPADYRHWTEKRKDYMGYFDRQGKPMSLLEWANKVKSNRDYKRVELTPLWLGFGRVSTVWLGLDYSFNPERKRPIIFESMVFAKCCGYGELDMDRYATEDEATIGHVDMIFKWSPYRKLLAHFWSDHIKVLWTNLKKIFVKN